MAGGSEGKRVIGMVNSRRGGGETLEAADDILQRLDGLTPFGILAKLIQLLLHRQVTSMSASGSGGLGWASRFRNGWNDWDSLRMLLRDILLNGRETSQTTELVPMGSQARRTTARGAGGSQGRMSHWESAERTRCGRGGIAGNIGLDAYYLGLVVPTMGAPAAGLDVRSCYRDILVSSNKGSEGWGGGRRER